MSQVFSLFIFSQWYSTPGIFGCTQSTSSSMWSLRASSEKFTASFLRISLLDLQPFGDESAFWEHLTHQLLKLSCHIFNRTLFTCIILSLNFDGLYYSFTPVSDVLNIRNIYVLTKQYNEVIDNSYTADSASDVEAHSTVGLPSELAMTRTLGGL